MYQGLIKFDDKDKIYEPHVTTSIDNDNWFLNFSVTAMAEVKDSIKKTIKYYLLPTDITLKILSRPDANSGTIDELIPKDTISIIYLDSPYWVCRYKNKIGYVHEMDISGIKEIPNERNEVIYLPYIRMEETENDSELKLFIKDIKTYSVMHVRLLSDCIKSDLEFSLKGSTSALNFVFSK